MNSTHYKEIHQFGHDDDRRYQLLMRRLRMIYTEKKQYTALQRLKRDLKSYIKPVKASPWKGEIPGAIKTSSVPADVVQSVRYPQCNPR